MKKILLAAVFCFTALTSFAQINFEQGYIIDNNGNREAVLIRNVEWRNNPTTFEYKVSEASQVQTASISEVREFGIGESQRFLRKTVEIDQSSDNLNSLSRTRNPEFKEETVFLRLLIDGEADLYRYTGESKDRFFYSMNDAPVQQLVYKQYESETGNQRRKNNYFRQQLLNDLSCEGIELNDVERVSYLKNDLRKFFVRYHKCIGADYVDLEAAGETTGAYNFKVKAGVNMNSVKLERTANLFSVGGVVEIKNNPGPMIGVEMEYVLPFNKRKWSVFADPSFYQVKGEQEYHYVPYNSELTTTFIVDYSLLSVPLGVRHYFYLNQSSAIFANAAYEAGIYMGGGIEDSKDIYSDEIQLTDVAHTFQVGAGYSWNKKISAEVKYSFTQGNVADHARENTGNFSEWQGTASYISLVLGYTIF